MQRFPPNVSTFREAFFFYFITPKTNKMKKFIIATIVFANALFCNAQEFMGVKVEGTTASIISQFKNKGFVLQKNESDYVFLMGTMNGVKIELHAFFTPISKKCYRFTIYLPKQVSWYSLKSEYNDYLAALTDKYGKPTETYEKFLDPYYEGDGYETTALAVEKCYYASWWDDIYLEISISKFKQIKILYQNPIMVQVADKEENSRKKNAL